MNSSFRHKKIILFLFDVILVGFSYYLASFLRFDFEVPTDYWATLRPVLLVAMAFLVVIYMFMGLYSSLWSVAGLYDYTRLVVANLLVGLIVLFMNALLNPRIPHSVVMISTGVILLGTLFVRMMFRIYRRIHFPAHEEFKRRNVLLVGAGDAAAMVIKEVQNHRRMRMNIVGLLDDDPYKQQSTVSGIPVIGTTVDLIDVVSTLAVDEIILAIPSATVEAKKKILNDAKLTNAKLKTLPGVYEIVEHGLSMDSIRDVDILDLLGRQEIRFASEEILTYIEGRTVLVTGGGGSIGSELCRQIARFSPKKLVLLDIYENNVYDLQIELHRDFENLEIEVLIASVRDIARINEIFENYRPQVVFHAAAHKHVPLMEKSPTEAIKNNVFGTYNVSEAAKNFKSEKFVLISTDKAVNPTNIMGATKRLCEMIIQWQDAETEDTDFVAVRFGNVLGSNGSVIPLFKKQIEQGGPVTLTHPEITRFFMTIPEAVQLVLQAGSFARSGEIYVLDMGEPIRILDLAESMIKLSGMQPGRDIQIEVTGLRPGEKLYEELLMAEEGLIDTPNELIFVGKPGEFDRYQIMEHLKNLKDLVSSERPDYLAIQKKLQEIVPTYKPKLNPVD